MKDNTQAKKQFIISYSLLYIGLIILSIFLICLKGISHIDSIHIVNITVDLFGMLVGYVLFISYDVDVQKTGILPDSSYISCTQHSSRFLRTWVPGCCRESLSWRY